MKFTMIKDYRPSTGVTLEAGNTYDSEKQNLAAGELDAMHAIGVCNVEGRDSVDPDIAPKSVVLDVQNSTLGQAAKV